MFLKIFQKPNLYKITFRGFPLAKYFFKISIGF